VSFNSLSGERAWSTTVAGNPKNELLSGFNAEPIARDGRVFVSTGDGRVAALEMATGSVAWSNTAPVQRTVDTDGGEVGVNIRRTISVATEDVLLIHRDTHGYLHDSVHALDPSTGEEQWQIKPTSNGSVSLSTPIVAGPFVYLTAYRDGAETGTLRVYRLESGEELARYALSGRSFIPPIIADQRVIVATEKAVQTFS
jgi:outer membrane protein assembly factor BamB